MIHAARAAGWTDKGDHPPAYAMTPTACGTGGRFIL